MSRKPKPPEPTNAQSDPATVTAPPAVAATTDPQCMNLHAVPATPDQLPSGEAVADPVIVTEPPAVVAATDPQSLVQSVADHVTVTEPPAEPAPTAGRELQTGQLVEMPIQEIQVPDGPPLNEDVIARLMASILVIGLLHALTIDRHGRLVGGRHRLEAIRRLGWTAVPCRILDEDTLSAELATIDENLMRRDITILERAELVSRRVVIVEAQGLRRRVGGQPSPDTVTGPLRSTADLATGMGKSERTLQRYQAIARIPEAVRNRIRGTSLAWSTNSLLKIAETPADKQPALIDRLLAEYGEQPSQSEDPQSPARSTAKPAKRRKKSQKPKPAAQKGEVGNRTESRTTTESQLQRLEPAIVEVSVSPATRAPGTEAEDPAVTGTLAELTPADQAVLDQLTALWRDASLQVQLAFMAKPGVRAVLQRLEVTP